MVLCLSCRCRPSFKPVPRLKKNHARTMTCSRRTLMCSHCKFVKRTKRSLVSAEVPPIIPPWTKPSGPTRGFVYTNLVLDEKGKNLEGTYYCSLCNSLNRETKKIHDEGSMHQKGVAMVSANKQGEMADGKWRFTTTPVV
jgi:hypothetical protein